MSTVDTPFSPLVASQSPTTSQPLHIDVEISSESPANESNTSRHIFQSQSTISDESFLATLPVDPRLPFPLAITTGTDDIHYVAMNQLSPIESYMTHIPNQLYLYMVHITSTFKFTWSYVVSQIKRTPRSFYVGCSTIVIVVAFISLLYNTIDKAGLVFLKLAEIKVGENDLLIQNSMDVQIKGDTVTLPMIMNYTAVYNNLYHDTTTDQYPVESFMKGITPRWILPSFIKLKDDETKNASVLTQIINSTNEAQMDLSRSWRYGKLLNNEVYLTRSVMRHLGFIQKEDIIGQILTFSISDVLTMFAQIMNTNNSDTMDSQNTEQSNAIHMAYLIYFIADLSGVDLYPSFGNAPDMRGTTHETCYTNNGMEYYGSESFSKSGIQCQSWFGDIPNNITHHTTQYSTNLQYNFCRNPNDGLYFSTQPWCYTVSSKPGLEKETCHIPNCLQNYTQCVSQSYDLLNADHKASYKQTCEKGIILSIQYAYFGLFEGTNGCSSEEDIFIQNRDAHCYKNMSELLYNECIGKHECIIADILQGVRMNETEYFADCPLYNDSEVYFTFISDIECNIPYAWNQKIYMNDTITNFTIDLMQQVPFFILPFEMETHSNDIVSVLNEIRGKTVTVDELRWILLISTLSNFNFNLEFVVRDIINEPDGKWSEEFGGVMLVESEFVQHYIDTKLSDELDKIEMYLEIINYVVSNYTQHASESDDTQSVIQLFMEGTVAVSRQRSNRNKTDKMSTYFSMFRINDFAQMNIINHMDRLHIYRLSYSRIQSAISQFASQLTLSLYTKPGTTNYLSASVKAPLLQVMKLLSFLKILLNSVMTSMTVMIAILSCIIIYCLMIIDVENKTFECGVLRSIGMLKTSVVYILNLKSLLFCVPGIIIGLIVSTLLNIPISDVVANYVTIDAEYFLSLSSVLVSSIVFGLIIPLLSGIIPLRKALSTTLSSSLNLYFNAMDQVLVTMINHNEYGINFMHLIIALLLICISFVCLYVIPYCLVTENFSVFFTVFDLIFLGLLFGLGIIATTIQNKLDDIVCSLLMSWGPQKKIRFLVHKNIHCHKNRNNKTGIMLILSSAFIVFNGCMVELQSDNFESLFRVLSGADIVFHALGGHLPEYEMRQIFSSNPNFNAYVDGYTFVTWSIEHQGSFGGKRFSFGPLGREYATSVSNHLVGVEENYCNVAFCDKYLVMSDINHVTASDDRFPTVLNTKQNKKDPIAGLYYNYNQSTDNVIFPPMDIISGHFETTWEERDIVSKKEKLTSIYLKRINILTSTAMKRACGVSDDISLKINVRFTKYQHVFYYLRYAMSPIIAAKVPGFYFSKHSQVAHLGTTLTTMHEFNYLLDLLKKQFNQKRSKHLADNETHRFPYNLKKQRLLIKMRDNATQQERTEVIDLISALLDTHSVAVTDTKKTIDGINRTTNLLSIFFEFVAITTMSLCFFISFISFRQNVYENIYQFGVLRSIGLNNINIVSMFVAESIIITMTSLICGTVIGITQSVSITLQSQILTENIFVFKFPTNLYLILITASSVIAVISSILPSIVLINTAPAHILRL